MTTIATLLIDLGANVARLERDMKQANRVVSNELAGMRKSAQSFAATFQTVLIGSGVAQFARAVLAAGVQSEQASNRLTATLRATGNQAGVTRGEMNELAEAIAEATQFDDDSVLEGQAALLKFGNIHGQVFRDALKVVTDYAAYSDGDFKAAAESVGKSLQSPTEGLRKLEQEFGKLSPAQEKHINDLVKQGKAIEAQNAVLDIWRSKIGGAAEQMNTGLLKATNDVKKAWDELLETFAKENAEQIQRTLGGAASLLKDMESAIRGVRNPLSDLLMDTLEWYRWTKLMPGVFGLVGQAAEKAYQSLEKARRTDGGRIDWKGTRPDIEKPAGKVVLGGNPKDSKTEPDVFWQNEIRAFQAFKESVRRNMEEEERRAEEGTTDAIQAFREYRAAVAATMDAQRGLVDELNAQANPMGVIESQQRRINDLYEQGAIGVETWSYHMRRLQMESDQFSRVWDDLKDDVKGANDFARDLGLTFESAFEKAISEGNSLRDVIKGLGQDIAKIIARKTITEPLGNAVSGFFNGGGGGSDLLASIFGSLGDDDALGPLLNFADGGRPPTNRPSIVGEAGPEVFWPDAAGTIIPNGGGGGGALAGGGSTNVGGDRNVSVNARGGTRNTFIVDMRGASLEAVARLERLVGQVNGSIERRAIRAVAESRRR